MLAAPISSRHGGGFDQAPEPGCHDVEGAAELLELLADEVGGQPSRRMLPVGLHTGHRAAAQVGQGDQPRPAVCGMRAAFDVPVGLQRVDQPGDVSRADLQSDRQRLLGGGAELVQFPQQMRPRHRQPVAGQGLRHVILQ